MSAQYNNQTAPQTVGSTNTVFITQTRFDPSYIRSTPGMFKCAIIILNALGFICLISSPFRWYGRGVYFLVVCVSALAFSGGMLALYVWHAVELYHTVPWLLVETVAGVIYTFLYLVAATVAVEYGDVAFSAAGFFGYLAMVMYGAEAYMKVRALKRGQPAQGQRITAKPTHILTPSALP